MEDNFPDPGSFVVSGSTFRLLNFDSLIFLPPESEGGQDRDIYQVRGDYGLPEDLEAMKASIKSLGLLEAPLVAPIVGEAGSKATYRVLEGNRRCWALQQLMSEGVVSNTQGDALEKIKCVVRPSLDQIAQATYQDWLGLNPQATDETKSRCMEYIRKEIELTMGQESLVRNTQRKNMNPLEIARQVQLQIDGGKTIDELAKKFGLAPSTLRSRLTLLAKEPEMPEVIQAIEAGEVGLTVGKLLANVTEEETRKELLETSKKENLSSDDVRDKINEKHDKLVESGEKGIKGESKIASSSEEASSKTNSPCHLLSRRETPQDRHGD